MIEPPTLETERLVLRPLTPEDGATVARLAGSREIADTTISIPHPYSEKQARAWIAARTSQSSTGKEMVFGVAIRQDAQLIGAVGLREMDTEHAQAEMGFWIGVPSWGRGYATEAGLASITFGFADAGLEEIVSFTSAANVRSRAVMERIGMTHEEADDFDHPELEETDPLRPHVLYRISAADLAH